MTEPLLVVVGHCTTSSARILTVFNQIPDQDVTLHYRAGSVQQRITAKAVSASPYSLTLFDLQDLPSTYDGTIVEYSFDGSFSQRFKLLPDGRKPLRLALVSCNGTFKVKDENRRYLLWRELAKQIDSGQVDLIVHAGDQVYADSIAMQCKEKHDAAWIASAYRKVYVDAWSARDVQRVLCSRPNLMMWDDHDIYDGYGSHGDDSAALARKIFAGAQTAFREFQAQHNPPRFSTHSYGFATRIGDGALLALDGRSNRMWTQNRILGTGQMQDVEEWLSAATALHFLFVVTAVPFVHVPVLSYLKILELTHFDTQLKEDLRDSWTATNNRQETERLLNLLFDFTKRSPQTKVVLLCGDVHVATVGQIESALRQTFIHQVVSSGIGSPPPYGIVRMMLKWAAPERVQLMNDFVGSLKKLSSPEGDHLLGKRNFAILEVGDQITVRFFADYKTHIAEFSEVL